LQKIFGVCLHPRFGGWFAMRGVLIFKDFSFPDLHKRAPPDVLKTDAEKIDLLEKFTYNWQDWTNAGFRDVIPVEEKYSDEQINYFDTKPKDRFKLLGIDREDGIGDNHLLGGHG
jgi:methylmalonic aciduria homocystinuria type C protein